MMFQVNPLLTIRIHLKNQALFSSKDNSKKLKCHLLQFLFGALRVKHLSPVLQIRRSKRDNFGINFSVFMHKNI